jgi:hypothetical protein
MFRQFSKQLPQGTSPTNLRDTQSLSTMFVARNRRMVKSQSVYPSIKKKSTPVGLYHAICRVTLAKRLLSKLRQLGTDGIGTGGGTVGVGLLRIGEGGYGKQGERAGNFPWVNPRLCRGQGKLFLNRLLCYLIDRFHARA